MSVFDLFRGFFGLGTGFRGGGRREPFFDGMTNEEEDEDEEDELFRFGFSLGPSGIHIKDPPVFGQMFRDIEDLLAGLGHFDRGFPSIDAPPQKGAGRGGGVGGSGNSLRDFMLKMPEDPPSVEPRDKNSPETQAIPSSPFHHLSPFFRFKDIWSDGPKRNEKKEDGDLDSQVSVGGLDQIFTLAPSQPKARPFFQSVTVTKMVKPDGTIEERRTVRDGQGNEEITVTRTGGPDFQEGPQDQPGQLKQDCRQLFSNMQDEFSMFSNFFGGFKG